jgi:hypothetical protein
MGVRAYIGATGARQAILRHVGMAGAANRKPINPQNYNNFTQMNPF